ncbi:cell wall hydrolase [Brevibacillus halotolerans]|uniref:cell wall hydrolase n=1 Tax=Brevibacillus halotolerans TaxID=1507437 RepID=UPI0015EED493|nr:cell wall hydrolase [Brevibacillus halotolerans]MBA4535223.1 cell wall hydrolase [Brevibacillus halotolerans]
MSKNKMTFPIIFMLICSVLITASINESTFAKNFSKSQLSKEKSDPTNSVKISDKEIYLLEQFVEERAINESYIGKVAVASVLLNRQVENNYQKTLKDIIDDFPSTNRVNKLAISPLTKKAVEDALHGWDPTEGSLDFYDSDTSFSASCNPKKNW